MLLLPDTLARHRDALQLALEEERIEDAVEEASRLSHGREAELLAKLPEEQVLPCLQALPPSAAGGPFWIVWPRRWPPIFSVF